MPSVFPSGQAASSFIEDRRAEVERTRNSAAQYFKVYGKIRVDGAGEAYCDIVFPVHFVDRPLPLFGGELGDGQTITEGSMPTYSAMIVNWNRSVSEDQKFLYVGALVGIVTTGTDGQVFDVHWSAEGVGLRSPAEDET